jgi:hypothetical protein
MVLPVKVFEVRGIAGNFVPRLRGFRETEKIEDEEVELIVEVLDVESNEGEVQGILSKDFLRVRTYRRRTEKTPTTEEAPFWIVPYSEKHYLIVLAPSVARGVKKLLSNHVAVKLGEILNVDVRETRIPSETLQKLHESNPKATNLIWFDDVDIPGVNKLCLSGQGLADTGLYKEYLDHGLIWYVVFTSQKSGYTVGVTRNTVITNFSKSSEQEFIEFVKDEILKLIE